MAVRISNELKRSCTISIRSLGSSPCAMINKAPLTGFCLAQTFGRKAPIISLHPHCGDMFARQPVPVKKMCCKTLLTNEELARK